MLLTLEPSEDGAQDVDAAAELVSATAWDGPLPAVRPARARVFQLMGLPEPVALPAAAGQAAGRTGSSSQQEGSASGGASGGGGGAEAAGGASAASADENASYQALLTHALRGM